MKLSVFKKGIRKRLHLLGAVAKFSSQETLAYSFNNWGGVISTVFYTLTFMAFISIIYSRVKTIAGYDYGEILFFTLIGQINFYSLWVWSIPSIRRLVETTKLGELDIILSRPIPIVWYLSIRRLKLASMVFEGLPALVFPLVLTAQNFHHHFTVFAVLAGIFTLILGQILIHCLHFITACSVIWTGEGKAISKLIEEIWSFGETVPYEGFPNPLKLVGTVLIPTLVSSAISTSYFLGKTTNFWFLILLLLLTIFFLYAKIKMWQFAMRHYSSASS